MRRALMAFVGMIGMLEKINWHNHIAWRLFNPRLQRSIVHILLFEIIRIYSKDFYVPALRVGLAGLVTHHRP